MSHPLRNHTSAGFTLIEMLVVAPVIIILIGVMIVMISSVTGDSLQARARNTVIYQTQDTLDGIGAEVARATAFLTTTGTLVSPQGSNGSTAAFTASSSVLIMNTPATDVNPIDSVREPIYYNSPSSCSSASVIDNGAYPVTSVYFVSSGTLWKRTILPSTGTPCSTPWQRASCATSATLTGVCKAYDEKLAENVTSFSIQYLNKTGGTVSIGNIQTQAKAVNITIATSKDVAGKTIAYQASTLSRAPNIRFSTTTTTVVPLFTYTGSAQTWTVPTGVTSIIIECWGAQGGIGGGSEGGRGGYAKGTLAVTPGETLNIYVGQMGGTYTTGGWNGGGNGSYSGGYSGGKGGGATDVRKGGTALSNRVIVGGGGGGAGYNTGYTYQGVGGGLTGTDGYADRNSSSSYYGYYGLGGTQTAGGTSGGTLGQGGGASGSTYTGGGGGGYYGGGGGAGYSTQGGGGSGYIGGVTDGTMTSGSRSGDGQVRITYSITTSDSPYED